MEQALNQIPNLQETSDHLDDIIEIVKKSEWRKSIAKATREYNLKIYNLNKLTPLRVKELHSIITSKFYKNVRNKDYWNENQLRLFIWTAFVYAGAIGKNPLNFEEIEWETISKCFADKTAFFCEFQFKCLKKVSSNTDKWVTQEEELLKRIVSALNHEDPQKLKWNDIAKQFYMASNKSFFRTAKQCREHWNTYLDPNKLKCAWSFNQDILLIKAVIDFGRKWSKIASLLQNKRSQHTVKNRYNSLVSKYLKVKNLKNRRDNVEAENIFEWLNGLEKDQDIDSPAKLEAISNMLSVPDEKTQEDPEEDAYEQQFPKPEERLQYIQFMTSGHMIDKVQSPAMLISPLPLNLPSIVFSPVNIYYKNDMDGGFNLFSFENLRQ